MTAQRIPRFARSCYGHLAGTLGVTVTEAMVARDLLCRTPAATFELTAAGREWFRSLGIDIDGLRPSRRPMARGCLDGTERRFHLGGSLAVALLDRMIQLDWLRRPDKGRALWLTEAGARGLAKQLGLQTASGSAMDAEDRARCGDQACCQENHVQAPDEA